MRTFLYSIAGFSNPSYVNSTTPKVISFGTCYHGPFLHLDSVKTRQLYKNLKIFFVFKTWPRYGHIDSTSFMMI